MIHRIKAEKARVMVLAAIFSAGLLALAVLVPTLSHAQQPAVPPPPPPGRSFGFVTPFGSGAWLGVNLKDVTAEQARAMKLPGEYGAIVAHVAPDSPAAKAGLKENDVILEFGGMRVWSAAQLAQLVRETPPGRAVELRISRSGKNLSLEASLARRSEHAAAPGFVMPPIHINPRTFDFHFATFGPPLGIRGETLTSQLASYFGVKQGKGVLVEDVETDSPAAKAGLKAGDCIVKVGSTPIASVFDLTNALADAKGSQVSLSIVRAKQEQTLTATIEPGWRQHHEIRGRVMGPGMNLQLREFKRELPSTEEIQNQLEKQVPRIQQQAQQLEQRAHQLDQRIQLLQRATSLGEV